MKKRQAMKEIQRLLTEEHLTPKQIIHRRKTSPSAVYQVIRKLRESGQISGSAVRGFRDLPSLPRDPPSLPLELYRLHGERFRCVLARKSTEFRFAQRQGRRKESGNTLKFFKESVIIYSHKSFTGATQEDAERQSATYWRGYLKALAENLRVSWGGVERVMAHYAYMGSEIARRPEYQNPRLQVRGSDGKVWFITDGSLGKEDETIGKRSRQDRTIIDRQLNAWRENPECPTVPELATLFKGMLEVMAAQAGYLPGQEKKQKQQPIERPDYAL